MKWKKSPRRKSRAAELTHALSDAEHLLEKLNAELAEFHARKSSFERAREVAAALVETSSVQLADAQARLDSALRGAADAPDIHTADADTEQARALTEGARARVTEAASRLAAAEAAEAEARLPLEAAEHEVQRLSAEAKALGDLLHPEGEGLFPPLVDAVTVQPGYEAALAAALGDDLRAPLDEASPHHWRDLGASDLIAPLPQGIKTLGAFVTAPPALARRLAMTGLVFPDQGRALQKNLKPGQRLVSARGDLWRWDGYAASADAPSQAAQRLLQRGRLTALEGEVASASRARADAFARYSAAKDSAVAARDATRAAAEQDERRNEQALIAAQDLTARVAAPRRPSGAAQLPLRWKPKSAASARSRDTALDPQRQASAGLAGLGDGAALAARVAETRILTADARNASSEARATLDGHRREGRNPRPAPRGHHRGRHSLAGRGALRRPSISGVELGTSPNRIVRRACAMPKKIARCGSPPNATRCFDAIAGAERARAEASDLRARAESRLAEADKRSKAADAVLSAAREDRARAQALSEAAHARIEELRARASATNSMPSPPNWPPAPKSRTVKSFPPLNQSRKARRAAQAGA